MARKKSKKSVKPIIVLLLLAILAVSVWLGIEKFKNSQEVGSTENKTKTEAPKEELKPKTFAGTESKIIFACLSVFNMNSSKNFPSSSG